MVATDEDIYVAEEEVDFHKAGEEILADINLEHPLVFDQYNICALVRDNSLTKFKLGLLQILSLTRERNPRMWMPSLILSKAVRVADALDLIRQI